MNVFAKLAEKIETTINAWLTAARFHQVAGMLAELVENNVTDSVELVHKLGSQISTRYVMPAASSHAIAMSVYDRLVKDHSPMLVPFDKQIEQAITEGGIRFEAQDGLISSEEAAKLSSPSPFTIVPPAPCPLAAPVPPPPGKGVLASVIAAPTQAKTVPKAPTPEPPKE